MATVELPYSVGKVRDITEEEYNPRAWKWISEEEEEARAKEAEANREAAEKRVREELDSRRLLEIRLKGEIATLSARRRIFDQKREEIGGQIAQCDSDLSTLREQLAEVQKRPEPSVCVPVVLEQVATERPLVAFQPGKVRRVANG
jgi:chromosome segregation ATPase